MKRLTCNGLKKVMQTWLHFKLDDVNINTPVSSCRAPPPEGGDSKPAVKEPFKLVFY